MTNTNTGNKVYNIFVNSANRSITDKSYDFTVFFDNDEIIVNNNEGVNVNVASFSLLNSMYNVNEYTKNNTFVLRNDFLSTNTTITIPYGNYNVYTLLNQLNILLSNIINVSYNVATNTYTYTNIIGISYSINPLNCSKLLGLSTTTSILTSGTIGGYINMVNYQQVILRCPTLVFESTSMDNIQDKNNFIAVSDFLFWINKQDVEPFKTINYKNEDCGTLYSYNVVNKNFSNFNFKLVNEFNEPIYDAPDFLLQLQITIYDKDNTYFKEASLQMLKLLNDIYFTVLNLVSILKKTKSHIRIEIQMSGSLQAKVYGSRQGSVTAKKMGSYNGTGKRMGSYTGSVKRLGTYTGVGGAKSNVVGEMYPHY